VFCALTNERPLVHNKLKPLNAFSPHSHHVVEAETMKHQHDIHGFAKQ
jgi:hypothetical protein